MAVEVGPDGRREVVLGHGDVGHAADGARRGEAAGTTPKGYLMRPLTHGGLPRVLGAFIRRVKATNASKKLVELRTSTKLSLIHI